MGEEMVKRIKPKESCRVQVISLTVWEGVGRREQEGGNAADLPQGLLAEGRATQALRFLRLRSAAHGRRG
jgi:hypothetical protein